MNEARRFRVALIGAGGVSRHHARAIQRTGFADIVAVCDTDNTRADALAGELRCPSMATLDDISHMRPDVVHVLTPPAFHCDVAIRALQFGSHVLVEKPMALSVRECNQMIGAAEAAGRILSVNHTARLDPIVTHALDVVRSGHIGSVLGVDIVRSNEYPPYAGGPLPPHYADAAYPLYDIGVHGLSLFTAFLGEIAAFDVHFRQVDSESHLSFDDWHGVARCDKGVGRLYLTFRASPFHNEVIVYGTRATIHLDCYLQVCTVRKPHRGPRWLERSYDAVGRSMSTGSQVIANLARAAMGRLERSPAIPRAIHQFYMALRNGESPPVTAQEGRTLTAWLEAAARRPREAAALMTQRRATPSEPADVLVTGGSGFLGAALVDRLVRSGQSVRVLVRHPANRRTHPLAQVVIGDLGNPDDVDRAVKGVGVVYHVGAAMGGAAADFECATVWGTRNVVAACLRHKVSRLVHVSSLSVLQHVHEWNEALVDENWPIEPHPDRRGHYTRTKLMAEQIVQEAVRRDSLEAVIVRLGMILGERAIPAAPSGTFTAAGRWIVSGSGNHVLPLVFIDDAVDALTLAAAVDDAVARVFHIVDTTTTVTQREYLNRCHAASVITPRVQFVPEWLLMLVASAAAPLARLARRTVPTRYQFQSLRPLSRFDLSAAQTHLGWTPTVGVNEGLTRVFPPARTEARTATPAGERATPTPS